MKRLLQIYAVGNENKILIKPSSENENVETGDSDCFGAGEYIGMFKHIAKCLGLNPGDVSFEVEEHSGDETSRFKIFASGFIGEAGAILLNEAIVSKIIENNQNKIVFIIDDKAWPLWTDVKKEELEAKAKEFWGNKANISFEKESDVLEVFEEDEF
jgi:hypothetical protein